MDVRNCKGCGKIFNYLCGAPLCPTCLKKLDDKFDQVKEYIYNNPGVGIQEVAEENEVSVSQIKRWVREERLAFSNDSSIGLDCEVCGKMIKTGRFCNLCKDKMANKLGNIYKEPEEDRKKDTKENPRMRFLDQ